MRPCPDLPRLPAGWDQQLVICPTSGSAPSTGVPDTRTALVQTGQTTAKHTVSRGGEGSVVVGRELVGLARFSGAVALVGRRCTIEAARSPRGFAIRNVSGRVARCALRCGGGRVGELPMVWLRCGRLVLPPGPAHEHVTSGARQLACGHPAIPGRPQDSCVAPGRDGPVGNGRAPASGTAARATTGFGRSANPTIRSSDGVGASGWTAREAGRGARTASGAGCRDGAPSRALHDQVDPTGLGSRVDSRSRRNTLSELG
jgi:hypothetical protein